MLLKIHYLRGIAALMVVLFHFRLTLNNVYSNPNLGTDLFQAGPSGVDIFFIISGFIIVVATQNKLANKPLFFLARRALRIYPALLVCWFVGAISIYRKEPLLEILKSAIPINRDYNLPPPTFGFNLMGPPWTLTYEILFYLVFCAAIVLSHKHRALVASLIMLVSIAAINLIFNGSLGLSAETTLTIETSSQWSGLLKLLSSTYLVEFIVGMALASFYLNKSIHIPKSIALPFSIICIGVFLTMFIYNYRPGFGPQGYGVWAGFLVTGLIVLEKAKTHTPKSAVLSYLGDISYSMYISHYIIIGILYRYDPPIWSSTAGVWKLVLAITITMLAASALHHYVEKPFIAFGKRLHSRAEPVTATKV